MQAAAGLTRLDARYCDPTTGRFTQPGPIRTRTRPL